MAIRTKTQKKTASPKRLAAAPAVSTLTAIWATHYEGFDRVVFQFDGPVPARRDVAFVPEIIADASGLTKAGLYHHIRSKEHLLLEIQNYGMDVFEERVLHAVMPIKDPLERLKECMSRNIHLVTEGWSKEVTIILHEHATLTGEARAHINGRKKRYVRFLEDSFADAVRTGGNGVRANGRRGVIDPAE